jgi:DNA-binding response OmpR family regulator
MAARALLIEPDPTLGKYLTSLVRQGGYECHLVASLEAGVDRLRQRHYRLVVLDLDFLGLHPLALAGQLVGVGSRPRLIGLDSMPERRGGDGAPPPLDVLLHKPFLADALLAALTDHEPQETSQVS